jgi:alkanesulfonate monooxygenase SsuD/methylene tetrahydromethanopterin reductase-like flavin-dependent oxidoreductase (luciferase family)
VKLALYLPNFREKVTVKELEDLTALAEDLDFDSVWTLDRIIVPEVSDRSGLKDPRRSANRIAKYGMAGWIGIQDSPEDIKKWRGEIQRELDALNTPRLVDDLEIISMIWFVITDEAMDQTPMGKGTNLLAGSAAQITDMLKRYREAGLTMPMLWPPFQDVPVAKTLDDLKRLREEIMPKVEAM